MLLTFYNVLRW